MNERSGSEREARTTPNKLPASAARGSRWSRLLGLAWRESRTARRRLLLYMSSISFGVAALVAIDSFSANVTASVHEQSRALLGGDIYVSANAAFPAMVES